MIANAAEAALRSDPARNGFFIRSWVEPAPRTTPACRLEDYAPATINDAHRYVLSALPHGLAAARRAGAMLLEVWATVPVGRRRAWVEQHCRCTFGTAVRYMLVAKHWPAISQALAAAGEDTSRVTIWGALAALANEAPISETQQERRRR